MGREVALVRGSVLSYSSGIRPLLLGSALVAGSRRVHSTDEYSSGEFLDSIAIGEKRVNRGCATWPYRRKACHHRVRGVDLFYLEAF